MVNKLPTAMNYFVLLCLNIIIDKLFTITWLIGNFEVTMVHFTVVLIKSQIHIFVSFLCLSHLMLHDVL